MKIEAGKYYRARDGAKTGPVRRGGAGDAYWEARRAGDDFDITFACSGRWQAGSVDAWDLVAEWPDEPQMLPIEPALAETPGGGHIISKADVLNKALATVADRGVPYGGVEDNFARIAHLWNGFIRGRFADGVGGDTAIAVPTFTPSDVAAMMALMKLGRIAGNPGHMDSWVDLAGYAACGGEINA